jgi:multicomponent Na+:H+ antiporter subunit C
VGADARQSTSGAMSFLPFAVAAWLFVIGLYGVVSSTNLVLLGVGYVHGGAGAIFADIPQTTKAVDPVVQVLVLTDIVIEATVTGLLLALAVQAHKRFGSLDPHDLRALQD